MPQACAFVKWRGLPGQEEGCVLGRENVANENDFGIFMADAMGI